MCSLDSETRPLDALELALQLFCEPPPALPPSPCSRLAWGQKDDTDLQTGLVG